jgi:CRISPR-associated protein Csd2
VTATIPENQTTAYLDPHRKHDFTFLFDVQDGNPNGDPDAGGMPRTDPETGHGLVSDVAIKRKIRNMVSLLSEGKDGYRIYVEQDVALNAQQRLAYADLGLREKEEKAGKDGKKKYSPPRIDQEKAQQWMCKTFFDVRMFGAVMSTGNALCRRVQGPLQINFSRSVSPVLAQEHGITRVTQTREEDIEQGQTTEMGAKHTIPYGLYQGVGHFSAPLAARTGVTSQDLGMLWRAFMLMFEHDRAAGRGEVTLRGLYVFTHADKFGSAPAQKLLGLVKIVSPEGVPPRRYEEHKITIPDDSALPDGVTLSKLVHW